jgi:YD repeat-containing protein
MALAPEASAGGAPPPAVRSLAAFEGAYDLGGQTLYLVSDGGRLAAVIGEAVYPLKHGGGDDFTNPGGQAVKFERDGAGRIRAVSDPNGRYPLTSIRCPSAYGACCGRCRRARRRGATRFPVSRRRIFRRATPPGTACLMRGRSSSFA